jgi:hypothetical protein
MRSSERVPILGQMGDDVRIIETCSVCGEGEPISSGAFQGYDGERVRWALWTCGHGWRSDATAVGVAVTEPPVA